MDPQNVLELIYESSAEEIYINTVILLCILPTILVAVINLVRSFMKLKLLLKKKKSSEMNFCGRKINGLSVVLSIDQDLASR